MQTPQLQQDEIDIPDCCQHPRDTVQMRPDEIPIRDLRTGRHSSGRLQITDARPNAFQLDFLNDNSHHH